MDGCSKSARQLAISHGLRVAGALGKPLRLAELTALLDGDSLPKPARRLTPVEVTLAELQQAFADDRLVVHYQPQVSLEPARSSASRRSSAGGCRRRRSSRRRCSSQIAEAAGLSLALTWRVIEKAAAQSWPVSIRGTSRCRSTSRPRP